MKATEKVIILHDALVDVISTLHVQAITANNPHHQGQLWNRCNAFICERTQIALATISSKK